MWRLYIKLMEDAVIVGKNSTNPKFKRGKGNTGGFAGSVSTRLGAMLMGIYFARFTAHGMEGRARAKYKEVPTSLKAVLKRGAKSVLHQGRTSDELIYQ